jgi:hypothetical protein
MSYFNKQNLYKDVKSYVVGSLWYPQYTPSIYYTVRLEESVVHSLVIRGLFS